jgi:hypothetical protein
MIENNIDCSILLDELEKKDLSLKEKKSFISLKLRYLVKNNIKHMIENILETHTLMNRDYWLIIEYYYNMKDMNYLSYYIMQKYISSIDTCDIDLMITKNWYDLIEKWDGFPVISSFDSNTINLSMPKYRIRNTSQIFLIITIRIISPRIPNNNKVNIIFLYLINNMLSNNFRCLSSMLTF